ncbi:hypothetical protein DFH09DRAFT_398384 [Mycena vulgaris]|nr:hypothetical protein DFH09DRAFT_398384 [Mycena vulgaris]
MAPRESSGSEIEGGRLRVRACRGGGMRRAGSAGGEKEVSVQRGTLRPLPVEPGAAERSTRHPRGAPFEDGWMHERDYHWSPAASEGASAPEECAFELDADAVQLVPVDHSYRCPRIHPTSHSHRARDASTLSTSPSPSSATPRPLPHPHPHPHPSTLTPPPSRRCPSPVAAASVWGRASEADGGLTGLGRWDAGLFCRMCARGDCTGAARRIAGGRAT